MFRARVTLVLVGSTFLIPTLYAQPRGLVISEFMAANRSTLRDGDRDFSDWIEVLNAGTEAVNLSGWYLSDDLTVPAKWPFPDMELGVGEFVLVFASGKDRRDPAGELHTNFRLDDRGEFLGLIGPDFNNDWNFHGYPQQLPDSSYGISMGSAATSLVEQNAPARIHVPSDGSLGVTWTEPGFDDAAWLEGQTGIGYDRKGTPTYADFIQTDIQEILDGVNSVAYIRIPFRVEDPGALDFLLLRMIFDDGFVVYLNGVELQAANAPDELTWDARATRNSATTVTWNEFLLPGASEVLEAGENVLAIHGLNRSPTSNDFCILPELTGFQITGLDPLNRLYFADPTPSMPNGEGFPTVAEAPQATIPGSTFSGSIEVGFTVESPEAVVRFTTNGSEPTEESEQFTAPITVDSGNSPLILKARAFQPGLHPSVTATQIYVQLDTQLASFSSNLPLAVCTTFGRPINAGCCDRNYVPGHFMLFTPGEDGRTRLTTEPHFADIAAFRRRGASTCGRQKFSFNVEIRSEFGIETGEDQLDKNARILEEFPEDSDYVMYGPYNFDRALMRNPIAYWMSRQVGRWAARTRFVECYFHSRRGTLSNSAYMGVYVLMEKNKRNPERVDVEMLTAGDNQEPEVMGGYILRRDRSCAGEITTSAGSYGGLVFVYPKLPTPAQRSWITGYLNRALQSLSPNIGSQEDSDLIDVMEWLDHHILNWYPKNVDAFRLSGYFHKKRDGMMAMGPVWDYDRTMGCADDSRAASPTGWDNNASGDGGTRYFQSGQLGSWYSILFQNRPPTGNSPWEQAYRARWRELRRGPLRTENIVSKIEEWGEELKEAAERNFARWPGVRPRFGSFMGEVNHLKNWLADRAEWIDSQFIEIPRFVNIDEGDCPCLVEAGFSVELAASTGAIYYTLDGTDPRTTRGEISASAILYEGPITITQNTRVTVRLRTDEGLWSSLVAATLATSIPTLTITELMYNPPAPTLEEDPEDQFSERDMEFIELMNFGTEPLDVSQVRFSRGVTFDFGDAAVSVKSLEPRQRVILVRNLEAFSRRYDVPESCIGGSYGGTLSNSAELVELAGELGIPLVSFRYDDDWHPSTDGTGYSLVAVNPRAPETLAEADGWTASANIHGSPCQTDPNESGSEGGQIPGDLTQDGRLNVSDAARILLYLFRGSPVLPCGDGTFTDRSNVALLDLDGDSSVTLTDGIHLLNYLFLDGGPPALGTECVPIADCPEICGD